MLAERLANQPRNREAVRRLLDLYSSVGETNKAGPSPIKLWATFSDDAEMLRALAKYYESHAELSKTWDVVKRLTVVEPSNVQNYLVLARISFAQNRKKDFYDAATRAIKLGGPSLRKALVSDPAFATWRSDPNSKKLNETQPFAQD